MTNEHKPQWVRFGLEIKRYRDLAGIPQIQLAKMTGWSRPMISAIENGTRTPKRDQVLALDEALATAGALERLWKDQLKKRDVPDWFRDSLAIERQAQEIREYEPLVIPGLLQVSRYATTLIRDRRITAPPEDVQRSVQIRTERLGALEANALKWFIIKESVLLGAVGDADIMREQLGHIVRLAEQGDIRVQVLPAGARTSIDMCLPFRVFTLRQTQTVAYAEHAKGGTVIDEPDSVEELRSLFGQLQAEALSPSESVRLTRKIMENRYEDVDEK